MWNEFNEDVSKNQNPGTDTLIVWNPVTQTVSHWIEAFNKAFNSDINPTPDTDLKNHGELLDMDQHIHEDYKGLWLKEKIKNESLEEYLSNLNIKELSILLKSVGIINLPTGYNYTPEAIENRLAVIFKSLSSEYINDVIFILWGKSDDPKFRWDYLIIEKLLLLLEIPSYKRLSRLDRLIDIESVSDMNSNEADLKISWSYDWTSVDLGYTNKYSCILELARFDVTTQYKFFEAILLVVSWGVAHLNKDSTLKEIKLIDWDISLNYFNAMSWQESPLPFHFLLSIQDILFDILEDPNKYIRLVNDKNWKRRKWDK